MNNFEFYVIDDLNKNNFHIERFKPAQIDDALNLFQSLTKDDKNLSCFGVQYATGSLDLVHRVNGDSVLVKDYLKVGQSTETSIQGEIESAVARLVSEGIVKYSYAETISVPNAKVVVPIDNDADLKMNSYCADKVLKTSHRSGLNSIDSLFVEGHGWVGFQELSQNAEKYSDNGILKVDMLNVCYAYKRNFVGLGGRMDITPSDFSAMANEINKPYALVAFDAVHYRHQYEGVHNFIVDSFNDLSDAVKAWYDAKDKRPDIPVFVQEQNGPGRASVVFNGVDEELNEISREQAAALYDFKDDVSLDSVLNKAKRASDEYNARQTSKEAGLESFDIEQN